MPEIRIVTRNGKTYEQDTTNIGKAKGPVEFLATRIPATTPATAAPEPIPVRAGTPKDTPAEAGDADEMAALREEIAELKALLTDTLADNEMMGRVFDADDQVKAAMDEARRQKALADNAERTLAAKSHEFIERARNVVYWKNRAEKAEKLNRAAA